MPDFDYHLLFVDDDEEFLQLLDVITSSEMERRSVNYSIKAHYRSSGPQALALIDELNCNDEIIALMVTDQMMPGMTGIELLERTKAVLPVTFKILLTAYGSLESAKYAINNRLLDQYITKPVEDPESFSMLISTALDTFHDREQKRHADAELAIYIEELEESNRKIKVMHTAAEKIAHLAQDFTNLDLGEVFTQITNKIPDIFYAKNASLFLLDQDDNSLYLARSNFLNETLRRPMLALSQTPMMVALRENRIIVVPDIEQSDEYTFLGKKSLGDACIIIPFFLGQNESITDGILGDTSEVRGVLNLGKIDTLESEDVVMYSASLIQNLMGVNILNAKLHQQTTRLALVDGLTGLHNKQVFEQFLDKDRELSERTTNPFFLALLDVDDFKKINDSHGHLVGDDVLKTLGSIFLKSARTSDVIARFGGDEFAWIIHSADKEDCLHTLDRIRNEINTATYAKHVSVSVSIGLTQFSPNSNDSVEDIFNRADSALYQAKEDGKNRTKTKWRLL